MDAPCTSQMESPQWTKGLFEDPSKLSWTSETSGLGMQTNRYFSSSTVSGRNIYVFGGLLPATKETTGSVERLDLDTMAWSSHGPTPGPMHMSEPRAGCAAAAHEDLIYVVGGYNGKRYSKTAESFNTRTGVSTKIEPMQQERYGCVATFIQDKMYVFGGRNGNSVLDTGETYNPAENEWSSLPSMTTNRKTPALAAVDGLVYVIGGQNEETILASAEVFDPVQQVWTALPPMSTPRDCSAAVAVGKYIVVLGGKNNSVKLDTAEIYSIEAKTWIPFPSMRHDRYGSNAVLLGNAIFVLGGCGTNDVEMMVLPQVQFPELPRLSLISQDRTNRLAALKLWVSNVKNVSQDLRETVEEAKREVTSSTESKVCHLQQEIAALQGRKTKELESIEHASQSWIKTATDMLQDMQEQIASLEAKLGVVASPSHQETEPPRQLVCPITLELLVDPVMAADGHTYERVAIEEHFRQTKGGKNPRSPATGAVLPSRMLIPNVAIRSQCREFCGN